MKKSFEYGLIAATLLFCFRAGPARAENRVETQTFLAGTDQELNVYCVRGEEKGPTVLVFAGIHGEESAGFLTADRYVNIALRKGTLIVVPRLNLRAVLTRKRAGYSGDLNRRFDGSAAVGRDAEVVRVAQALIGKADYVLNLHQGTGFYSPTWVNQQRNPSRWGQSNVIDTPVFDLANGERLELERFAQGVVRRANVAIPDPRYHFHVNNTDTASRTSRHKEQRKSLTYYAVTKAHRLALGLEATKNCTESQAVAFLSIAVNAVIREAGLAAETLPSEDAAVIARELATGRPAFEGLGIDVGGQRRYCRNGETITLAKQERLRILTVVPSSLAGTVTVDVKGFAGGRSRNEGHDLGYDITAALLKPGFALDAGKTRYRIEVRAGRTLVGELFLQAAEPRTP